MIIRDEGFAIRYEFDEDEAAETAAWDYSHLLDGDPLPFGEATTTRATQRKAKREDYQPQLF